MLDYCRVVVIVGWAGLALILPDQHGNVSEMEIYGTILPPPPP